MLDPERCQSLLGLLRTTIEATLRLLLCPLQLSQSFRQRCIVLVQLLQLVTARISLGY
jgi:hypothetical protein